MMATQVKKMFFGIFHTLIFFMALLLFATCANATKFKGVWSGTYESSLLSTSGQLLCQCNVKIEVEQNPDDLDSVEMTFSSPTAKSKNSDEIKTCQGLLYESCDGNSFYNTRTMSTDNDTFMVSISKSGSTASDVNFVLRRKKNVLTGDNYAGSKMTLSLQSDEQE